VAEERIRATWSSTYGEYFNKLKREVDRLPGESRSYSPKGLEVTFWETCSRKYSKRAAE
jgi:hypothetical protein